jgi:hypothetical protein
MNFLERAKLYLGAKPIKTPKHSNLKFDPLLLVLVSFYENLMVLLQNMI